MQTTIRKAVEDDNQWLTSISFEAKRHWNYPAEYYERWRDELTISRDYIRKNIVYVVLYEDVIVGFYSIVENPQDFWSGKVFVERGFWLEHIFIKPEHHRLGIGRKLIEHAKQVAKARGIERLWIFVDPYAKGFYDKIGARFMKESPSSIEGRLISIYELEMNS